MAGKSMKKSSTAVAKRSSETAKTKSSASSQSRAVKAPAPSARLKAGEEKGVKQKDSGNSQSSQADAPFTIDDVTEDYAGKTGSRS